MAPEIRAVFFDAVGTLLFPAPSAPVVYAAAARQQGLQLSPEQVLERFLAAYRAEEAHDRSAGWATSETRERERWRRIVFETLAGVADPESCFDLLFTHFACSQSWTLHADAAGLFAGLADRGIKLGLASNYDSRLHSVVRGIAALNPLRDAIVISSEVGWRKPGGAFFAEVARLAGCDREHILFVGDDLENDYKGAAAAGMQAVLLDEPDRYKQIDRRIQRLRDLANIRR